MMVRLSQTDLMVAAYVGAARNVQALTKGYKPSHGSGYDNTWTRNIEGACAELAVATLLDLKWPPAVGDRDHGDAGPYEVRCNISRKWTDTALHEDDWDDRAYIGVLSFTPDFDVMGWIWGRDGKRPEWWREGEPGRPAFWVPCSALLPMSDLPDKETLRQMMAREAAA